MVMSSITLGIRDRTRHFDPSNLEIGHIFHLSLSHIPNLSPYISTATFTLFTPWGDLHRCCPLQLLSFLAVIRCSCPLLSPVTLTCCSCPLLLCPILLLSSTAATHRCHTCHLCPSLPSIAGTHCYTMIGKGEHMPGICKMTKIYQLYIRKLLIIC